MVGRQFLWVAAVVASLVATTPLSATAASPASVCDTTAAVDGDCVTGAVNNGGVTLTGHKHIPGTGGGTNGGKGGSGTRTSGGSGGSSSGTTPQCTQLAAVCQQFFVIPPGAPGNPSVTINDLKNFTVTPGSDHMEPNGWMVVGLATNFYSVVGLEVKHGKLLGQPASVRFTPISWHWTYGDGSAATRATPGTTWANQRIPEFDATPTSHVYTADGTYFIDLSITFRAEYEYATGGWLPVFGTLTVPANRLEATAGDAKTVLVGRDCTANPAGPGC